MVKNKGKKGKAEEVPSFSDPEIDDIDFPLIYPLWLTHKGKTEDEVEEDFVLQESQIRKEKAYTRQKLVQFVKFHFKILERISVMLAYEDGTILQGNANLFLPERRGQRINVLFQNIRNSVEDKPLPGYRDDAYFVQHGIVMNNLTTLKTFDPCIALLRGKFTLEDALMKDLKREVSAAMLKG